jgi:hypothetical protein
MTQRDRIEDGLIEIVLAAEKILLIDELHGKPDA